MKNFQKHNTLLPHHRYQLEVIFLFTFGLFLFFPYYLIMDEFKLNMLKAQWYFFWPWMIFYTLYSLNMRSKIKPEEKVNPLKRPIGHWVLLGVTITALNLYPSAPDHLQALDLSFLVFSLFLADSYWDFKKLQIFKKR